MHYWFVQVGVAITYLLINQDVLENVWVNSLETFHLNIYTEFCSNLTKGQTNRQTLSVQLLKFLMLCNDETSVFLCSPLWSLKLAHFCLQLKFWPINLLLSVEHKRNLPSLRVTITVMILEWCHCVFRTEWWNLYFMIIHIPYMIHTSQTALTWFAMKN